MEQRITLPALQKTFVDFLFEFAWGFCIENGRMFGELFLVSVSHKVKHENSSKISENVQSKIRGKIRDENLKIRGTDFPGEASTLILEI